MIPEPVLGLWPVILSTAAVCGVRWRGARRRTALNRAMHELRRPLHAMALGPGPVSGRTEAAPDPLDRALVALDDLDAVINGRPPALARRPVPVRPLVEGVLERWRTVARRRDAALELDWRAGVAIVNADPARVAQALDNLVANALEHGRGRVCVQARPGPVGLSLSVVSGHGGGSLRRPDPRRGHGLAVVERVATAHLGRFRIATEAGSVAALLELPLAAPTAA